jgi:SAM-dependent methyltransferase
MADYHELDPKHLVRDSYDRISHAYRGDMCLDRGYFRWLDILKPNLKQGDAVLDLGCGCGIPVAEELSQQCNVTGIDISPVQIDRARKLVPNGTFECQDMATVEFNQGQFAAIVALFSTIHLPEQEHRSLFARMFVWLRPGGYLLISLGHSAWTGYEEDWYGAPMYWSHPDEQTSLDWLRETGFEVLWQEFLPEGKTSKRLGHVATGEGGHRIVLARRAS